MNSMRPSRLLAIFAALPLLACSSPSDESAAQRQAIVEGTPAVSDGAIVMIGIRRPANGPLKEICTGTVISPHVVLTAAHCLHPDIVGADAGFYVFEGDDIWAQQNDVSLWFQVASVTTEPRFDPKATSPKPHDIGFVVLATASDRTPMPVKLDADPPKVGDAVRQIGYGYRSADGGGDYCVRRQLAAVIDRIDPDSFKYSAKAPASPCYGDSGGPLLGAAGTGEQVVGVFASFVATFGSCDGRIGYAIPTGAHADFLEGAVNANDPGFLNAHPDGGTTSDAGGTPAAASPASGCNVAGSGGEGAGWLLGVVALVGRLRRRR